MNQDFKEKESVLCYHGNMLYEAKILRITTDSGKKYMVHYKGWKEKYDEFVDVEKLVKLNEEGLALQEELRSKTANGDEECDKDNKFSVTFRHDGPFKMGKFLIPIEITELAGKDWDIVNRNHYLLLTPAKISASDVIEEFRKVYRKKKIVGLGVFDQFTNGLKRSLDDYIGRGLLHKHERLQLEVVLRSCGNKPLSEIYGPILLIRYLLKLPYMIDEIGLGKNSQVFMTTKKLVDALMKFVIDYRKDFFITSLYYKPDDRYEDKHNENL